MQQKRWTSDEMELLRAFYPHSFTPALCHVLPGRTSKSINCKANVIGIKKTEKFIRILNDAQRLRPEYGLTRIKLSGHLEVFAGGKWRRLSNVIWEQHHGKPVPSGHIITYADGDKLNVEIDNLRLISRREALEKVSFSGYPKEIRGLMLISNKIKKEINERT